MSRTIPAVYAVPTWHSVTIRSSSRWDYVTVKCHGYRDGEPCSFGGRYPDRAYAHAVVERHLLHTHATGKQSCGRRHCSADALLRGEDIW